MEINRAAIKANAKGQMRMAKPHAVLVALVYVLTVMVLQVLSSRLMGNRDLESIIYGMNASGNAVVPDVVLRYATGVRTPLAALINLALSLMLNTLSAGFTIYTLKVSRLQPAGFVDLLEGFSMFIRVLVLMFLEGLFVFLWSMLLFIPGIIAAYSYRMSLYLLIDNPHMSVMECIGASKQMMRGRKAELFVLDLSFIGWTFLSMIPFVSFWVTPYTAVTYANYYNALIGLNNGSGGGGGGYREEYRHEQAEPPRGNTDRWERQSPPPRDDGQSKKDGWNGGKPPWEL